MTSKTVLVSAPGKIILFGEHSVVYGKKAIATSLDLRTSLKSEETSQDLIILNLPALNSKLVWQLSAGQSLKSSVEPLLDAHTDLSSHVDQEVLQKINNFLNIQHEDAKSENMAVVAFLYLLVTIYHKCALERITITVESSLPLSAGLGSSASYCVCLAAAILTRRGNILSSNIEEGTELSDDDKKTVNKWAFLAEHLLHGKPSGIDNSVATFGKAIEFKSGEITFIENMPKLKILLVNTNVARSTKDMVTRVKHKYAKYPSVMEALMGGIEEITLESCNCLQKLYESQNQKDCDNRGIGDNVNINDNIDDNANNGHLYTTLNELVEMSQGVLRCVGVSHSAIEAVLEVLQRHHLTGKLTGAGGGGCVFAFIPPGFPNESLERVKIELEEMTFTCFESCVGGYGVKVVIKLEII